MCGRFTLKVSGTSLAELFELETPLLPPRYNIAPTQPIAAVRLGTGGQRELAMLRWGLIPSWADDPAIGNRMIITTVADELVEQGVKLWIHPSHNVPGDTTAHERLDGALREYKRRIAGV